MYDSESSSEAGWIEWFCDLEGHEFFVAVSITDNLKFIMPNISQNLRRYYDRSLNNNKQIIILYTFIQIDLEYIRDSFNLYGLKERIPKYK